MIDFCGFGCVRKTEMLNDNDRISDTFEEELFQWP